MSKEQNTIFISVLSLAISIITLFVVIFDRSGAKNTPPVAVFVADSPQVVNDNYKADITKADSNSHRTDTTVKK